MRQEEKPKATACLEPRRLHSQHEESPGHHLASGPLPKQFLLI